MQKLVDLDSTIVLYESPHRILKTLRDISVFFGDQILVSVSREISKIHEEVKTAPVEDIIRHFSSKSTVKGEIVIIISRKMT